MGTNFYWLVRIKYEVPEGVPAPSWVLQETRHSTSDDPTSHIGKRSAAGLFCWGCNVTLCAQGPEYIHGGFSSFHEACPKCHQAPKLGHKDHSAAHVELGFQPPAAERPTGISSCASFSWAQHPTVVGSVCERLRDVLCVVDEYGREFTGGQFLEMLHCNCPIEFTDSIGEWFS